MSRLSGVGLCRGGGCCSTSSIGAPWPCWVLGGCWLIRSGREDTSGAGRVQEQEGSQANPGSNDKGRVQLTRAPPVGITHSAPVIPGSRPKGITAVRPTPIRTAAFLLAACVSLGPAMNLQADEGMWLLNEPPRQLLKDKYGFDLTADWLERAQQASVRFNNGGSGSVRLAGRPDRHQPPHRGRQLAKAQPQGEGLSHRMASMPAPGSKS